MKIEELENKLKITKNTCIHCQTLELAKQVLDIFNKLGLKWFSGEYYTLNHNWDILKKNTVYYPFHGTLSSLKYAQQNDYKIISAQKFIGLHTEEFNLENYEPKGQLKGYPKEIISRMLDCQEEQGNKRDVSVFEKDRIVGFVWIQTKEGLTFWDEVIRYKNFDLFFEKYPKQDNQEENQKFKVEDKVIDIITGQIGVVSKINILTNELLVLINTKKNIYKAYNLNGKYNDSDKYPMLLHYRDDYDYSVIDFNNLPKRQNPNKWRAKKNGVYNYVGFDNKDGFYSYDTKDDYVPFDDNNYNLGNYFSTEVEAEIIAQKLNEYFKQLINQNK